MTTVFASSMINHLKQSAEYDDLMTEKNKYPEEFGMFNTNEYLLLFFVVGQIKKNVPFVKLLKLLGTDYKNFLMSLYRESFKTIKKKDIKTSKYNWADIEDDGSYDDLRSFIKEYHNEWLEIMPEILYTKSYFPSIPLSVPSQV